MPTVGLWPNLGGNAAINCRSVGSHAVENVSTRDMAPITFLSSSARALAEAQPFGLSFDLTFSMLSIAILAALLADSMTES